MRRWKSRTAAFAICFMLGLSMAFIYSFIAGLFSSMMARGDLRAPPPRSGCVAADYFARPEELLSALKSEEVSVRRDIFRRLFLSPGSATIYYDYERDVDYPERADRARLQYVNLDESADEEALLTFVRYEHPVALVLKKDSCGWRLVAALGSWLRFEEYPYRDWLELPEALAQGTHEILIHESRGDADSYVRRARLLKLIDGALREIALFDEEAINPPRQYTKPDWAHVMQRSRTSYLFRGESEGGPARISLETTDELVKYSGAPPAYSYWLETDGAWHAAHKNWTERPATRLELLGQKTERLVWNEREEKFVKADS